MSPRLGTPVLMAACFPRVSGDEPIRADLRVGPELFSPRERG